MRDREETSAGLPAMSMESVLRHVTVGEHGSHLDRLPVELTIKVLCRLHDLVSLDSLIRASPTAYRVFASYAVEVTEAVLQREYPHIRVIFRYLALLRSGTFPAMSYSDFVERVINESMRFATRVRCSRYGFVPKRLARDTEPAVIRSGLSTARLIKCAALDCLDFYLARFRTLQPEHPVDKNYEFVPEADAAKLTVPSHVPPWSWQSRPEGVKVEVRDVGPPSWIEEQRATRAFWRLQLLYDLKQAAASGRLAWEEHDLIMLRNTTAVNPPVDRDDDMKQPGGNPWQARYGPYQRSHKRHRSIYDLYGPFWTHVQGAERAAPPEHEELVSVLDYIREAYGPAAADRLVNGQVCFATLAGSRAVHRPWPAPPKPTSREWKDLVGPSHGVCRYFWSIKRVLVADRYYHSRLPSVGFDVFGRYGFAFWSAERMRAYGLEPVSTSPRQIPLVDYAWESILGPGDIAKVERKSRGYLKPS